MRDAHDLLPRFPLLRPAARMIGLLLAALVLVAAWALLPASGQNGPHPTKAEWTYLLIEDFRITQKEISFGGLIGNRGHVDTIKNNMQLMPFVKAVEVGRTDPDKNTGRIKFDIRAVLKPTTEEEARR